ncbi:MAG: hypothetical protein Ct9H300mP16_16340 [Pseudomonadota bacterium]|nr:MAG: hypothetical protein Ct9H300mP16_16340 [Pseudomonadota bacterium]
MDYYALQWLLRPVSDFYLRSDDCHVYSVFSGSSWRTSFPMRGASFYWWQKLIEPSTVGDMQGALLRSLILALIVMVSRLFFRLCWRWRSENDS